MTVLLRSSEVEDLVDLKTAMAVLEEIYVDQANGEVKAIPPLRLMDRGIRLVAGGLGRPDRVGIRLSPTGGDAVALIYEMSSGRLLSIMNYPFSELRIAATVGLALDRLAGPDARSAALIGSGRLAPSLLQAATGLRPIERVRVYSRSAERREPFARQASVDFGIAVGAVSDPLEALAGADIVLVSTNSPEPALRGEWLRPGQPVFGCGRPNEFDDETYLRSGIIVVSSKNHELGYYDTQLDRPLIRLSQENRIVWEDVMELGQLVAREGPPPGLEDGIAVFRESQGGYSDVALANFAYEQAVSKGRGQAIVLD